ncbi:MAG: alpha/beta fold hydrolase [Edaphobacter sp.]|uniref:alpha/beta hydrolase family protein n=1 Tax=Edaphobacter sp. TaxID=1934404 RepID=UPI002383C4BB|nr:alpha/beta fold hydrolase [Edaphobacter sp.]MDE1176778.1 alpha/beta fold hydrolase [Edaphobacter sp.]
MPIRNCVAILALSVCLPISSAVAQTTAIAADPATDKAAPAAMQSFQLPSHGALLNAFVYVAAGSGPHPVVVLLHGFPGNERNLDLAQAMRRAGYDVLFFDYRGSWGSPGSFSFGNGIEDTLAAAAYMREPVNAARFRADAKKIVLVGHSMGGFMALNAAALDPAIVGVVTISAADLGTGRLKNVPAQYRDVALKSAAANLAAQGMAPLAGCTPESLAAETLANAAKWNFVAQAPKLVTRPLLVITSDDGLAPPSDEFVSALKQAGDTQVSSIHIADDHSYSAHRITLEEDVLAGLAAMPLH